MRSFSPRFGMKFRYYCTTPISRLTCSVFLGFLSLLRNFMTFPVSGSIPVDVITFPRKTT